MSLLRAKGVIRDEDREANRWDDFLDWYYWHWDNIRTKLGYFKVKRFVKNIPFFAKLAWHWSPWDYSYTINVLIELLKANGRACRSGYGMQSEKIYRRAMTAAGLLERAYNKDADDKDNGYKVFHENNPLTWGNRTIRRIYKKDEAYYLKMDKIINERVEKNQEQDEKDAWDYLRKYIRHFWD